MWVADGYQVVEQQFGLVQNWGGGGTEEECAEHEIDGSVEGVPGGARGDEVDERAGEDAGKAEGWGDAVEDREGMDGAKPGGCG